MLNNILIVGHLGNMGRRYAAILDYLGIKWDGIDIENKHHVYINSELKGIIIATSTFSHVDNILDYSDYNVPILCEKPITLNPYELNEIKDLKIPLRMVNQYKYCIEDHNDSGNTRYNYYNSGKDGLAWDCINIISLAKSGIDLKNNSPFWIGSINGKHIDKSYLDISYIDMIRDWLETAHETKEEDMKYILHAHKKVHEYIEKNGVNNELIDRNPS